MAIDTHLWDRATEAQRDQMLQDEFSIRVRKVTLGFYALITVLSIVPLAGVYWSVRAVAGKNTTISISIVATASLAGATGLGIKVILQRREIKRLRRRANELEADVDRPEASRPRLRELEP